MQTVLELYFRTLEKGKQAPVHRQDSGHPL